MAEIRAWGQAQHLILLVDANYLSGLEVKKAIETTAYARADNTPLFVQIVGSAFESLDALGEARFSLSIVDAECFSPSDTDLLAKLMQLPAGLIILGSATAIGALPLPRGDIPVLVRPYQLEDVVAAVMTRLASI